MTTRSAVVATIALIVVVLGVVALAALFAGDISERQGGIITSVLGSFATVLAGLLLFLRLDTVTAKVDDVASKAEDAAEKAAAVAAKAETIHHDLLNGGLRENVKRAIRESEADPVIRAGRVDNVARGVSQDRHAKAQHDTLEQGQRQLAERREQRRKTAPPDPGRTPGGPER